MSVPTLAMELYRASRIVFTGTFNDVSPPAASTWAIEFIMRRDFGFSPISLTLTTAGGAVVADDAGNITITFSETDIDIPAGTYVATIYRTDTGSKEVLATGTAKVLDHAAR